MMAKQIQKPVTDWSEYTGRAIWCNANKAEVKGDYYEVIALPERTLEEANAVKRAELNAAFVYASETAHCLSAAGFGINADETAKRYIASLIIAPEASAHEAGRLCAYDNCFQDVTLAQLKTMQLEIIANAQAIYQEKWGLRKQINEVQTLESPDAIVIDFNDGEE